MKGLYYLYGGSSSYHLVGLVYEILSDPKSRRKLFISLLAIVGFYLVLTNGVEVVSEKVVFYGYSIQGYGLFTTATFTVCTDPGNRDMTEFEVYHHSLGTWKPTFEYEDESRWCMITYQKTLLGNKLLKVEPA